MLTVQVDRNEPTPLHDQIAAEIRRAVAGGEARPGGRLLLAKDLAAVLGVNKNTVLRALHILRNERLLECQRGRGITVAGSADRGAGAQDSRSHRVLPQPGLSPRRGHPDYRGASMTRIRRP